MNQKIVIFGGSFDPVHNGHTNLIKIVREQFYPNLFIIIPSKIPPLKNTKNVANGLDRLNMLRLAFKNDHDVLISDYEVKKNSNSPSYTIDTLKHFKKQYQNDQLYLLIGSDRYLDFKG